MSAGGRPPFHFLLATLLLFLPLSFSLSNAGKSEPQSYKLAVQVAYGDSFKGAESFREELELQLLRELQYERCFREAIAASAQDESGADLLLLVLIQNMEERTDYELTIAQRDSPYATAAESRISRIVLTGGGSRISGFDAAFQSKTNIPVEHLNSLAKMIPSSRFDEEFLEEVSPSLGVSVGLALRRTDD